MPPLSYFGSPIVLNKTRGRQHGAKNKATESIRWGIVEAYRQLGGVDGLVQWGKANPSLFYPMLVKLLPAELAEAGHGSGITVIVQRQIAPTTETVQVNPYGEIPDSGGQGMGPDVGTLTHESQLTLSGVPTQSGAGGTGGDVGRARTGEGSPTGGQ